MRYQFPVGPVCDWPAFVDCGNEENEDNFATLEPEPRCHVDEECLPYDDDCSLIPDCNELCDENDPNTTVYQHHSSSKVVI